jgi:DNA-binding ferritin-like protein
LLGDHSSMVVSAVSEYATKSESLLEGIKSWMERIKEKIKFRGGTKSGRTISAANLRKLQEAREKLRTASDTMKVTHDELEGLINIASPEKEKAVDLVPALMIAIQKHQNDLAGVPSQLE